MKTYDIIVVGAGILGIAHAYHCLQAGLKVALFEKTDYPRAATARNFGQVVPSGFATKWQSYGRESLDIYKSIQKQMDISVRPGGSIYLASNAEELVLLQELWRINQDNHYNSELLTRSQCLEQFPGLQPSYVLGGLYFPEEVTVDPRQVGQRLIQYCIDRYDLDYYPHTLANEVSVTNGEVELVTNHKQQYKAQKLFLCSGNEFQLLFPELFQASDLQLVKLQMLAIHPPADLKIKSSILTGWTIRRYESFQECPSFRSIKTREDETAYHRQKGIHILFKQADDGSIILGDSHEYTPIQQPEALAFDTDHAINQFILSEAQKIFQLDRALIRESWQGYYCQSASDDIFNQTIDQHIHIVTGIGGKGMTASLGYAKQHIQQVLALNSPIL